MRLLMNGDQSRSSDFALIISILGHFLGSVVPLFSWKEKSKSLLKSFTVKQICQKSLCLSLKQSKSRHRQTDRDANV